MMFTEDMRLGIGKKRGDRGIHRMDVYYVYRFPSFLGMGGWMGWRTDGWDLFWERACKEMHTTRHGYMIV